MARATPTKRQLKAAAVIRKVAARMAVCFTSTSNGLQREVSSPSTLAEMCEEPFPRFERGAGGVATRPRTPALDTVVMVFLRSRGALGRLLPSGSYTDKERTSCHSDGSNLKPQPALRRTAPSPLLPPVGAKFLSAELSHPLQKRPPFLNRLSRMLCWRKPTSVHVLDRGESQAKNH